MVFRKYSPMKQWGKMDTRIFKGILKARNERKMPSFRVPDAVKALNVPIYDPNDSNFFEKIRQHSGCNTADKGVQLDHPALRTPSIEDHPLYKPIHCKLFDGSEAMSDGMAQACALSKAVLREGFPNAVMENSDAIGVSEEKVRDAILHGEKYDPTLEKLPVRFDPVLFWIKHVRVHGTPVVKRNNIILNNLYRQVLYASLVNGNKANQFRLDRDEPLSATLFSAPFFNENPLVLRFQPHLTVQATKENELWAEPAEVERVSSESVPDIFPLSPTIDLGSDNIYNDNALLARQDSQLFMHTAMWTREQDQKYPWTTEQNAANAILHTFGAAYAQATRGGVKGSEKPILVKGVQLCDGKLDLVAFQLNTVDLSSENTVKNIVWVERAAHLYTPKPFYEQLEDVHDVNMETFKKLAALITA